MGFVSQYGGNQATGKHTGMKGIRAAIDAGMTINQIREQLAREGVQTGSKATEFLAARPETSFISQYGGNEYTMQNAGMQSIGAALQAGLTPAEIEKRAGAEGVSFGVNARSFLDTQRAVAESQQRFQQMQQAFLAQQRQAEEAAKRQARQMQIAQAMGQQDPADVRFSRSRAEREKLTATGTSGYFGRKDLRISGLNIPGKSATSNNQAGSFA